MLDITKNEDNEEEEKDGENEGENMGNNVGNNMEGNNEGNKEGYILVGGNNPNIQIYSIRNAAWKTELVGHTDSVTCMATDGYTLFTGSDDCTIRQWELSRFFKAGIIGEHDERKCTS